MRQFVTLWIGCTKAEIVPFGVIIFVYFCVAEVSNTRVIYCNKHDVYHGLCCKDPVSNKQLTPVWPPSIKFDHGSKLSLMALQTHRCISGSRVYDRLSA